MKDRQKIYFASDFHLGMPDHSSSRQREDKIVAWLDEIKNDAAEIYLLGDLYDFWFEYKKVIPKGFIRLQGKLAELSDKGIKLYIFKGNHDLWMNNYFVNELNAVIYSSPINRTFQGKTFYLAHGDGLGPGDHGFKFMKKIFLFPINQWLFRWIHPDLGARLAHFFSFKSRIVHSKNDDHFLEENEWLVQHSREILKTTEINYFVYGHRHVPAFYPLNDRSIFVNLGDWITHFTYLEFDGEKAELKTWG